jgi:hypothetical protein
MTERVSRRSYIGATPVGAAPPPAGVDPARLPLDPAHDRRENPLRDTAHNYERPT